MRDLIKSADFAVLSASRGTLSDADNQARTNELAATLRSMGLRAYEADGVYTYLSGPEQGQTVHERSLLVPGLPRDVAVRLGKRYSQESVLVGSRLVSASTGADLAVYDPAQTVFGAAAMHSEYSTRVTFGGRSLSFSLRLPRASE